MKITIEGADKEFAEKLVVLAAEHRAELTVTTVDTGWTVDRAETYLTSLTGPARHFAQQVVYADGMVDAEELRRIFGSLRGPRIALARAVTRGLREGWWPQGTPEPITPVYDPDNPSWQKAIAYRMSREDVPIFREALVRMATTQGGAEREAGPVSAGVWEGDAPSALAPAPGWGSADDVPLVTLDEDEDR